MRTVKCREETTYKYDTYSATPRNLRDSNYITCPISMEETSDYVVAQCCKNAFSSSVFSQLVNEKRVCPLCRGQLIIPDAIALRCSSNSGTSILECNFSWTVGKLCKINNLKRVRDKMGTVLPMEKKLQQLGVSRMSILLGSK